jgi:HlyD family secretion protein
MNFNKRLLLIVPAVIIIISAVFIILNISSPGEQYITGLVEIKEIDIASKIPGRLDSMFVTEGSVVKKGDILAKLESREMDAKLEQTFGQMEAAKFKYEMAVNGARPEEKEAVEKQYQQAKHQFELAEKTWKRMSSLYKDNLLSAQEKDQFEFQYKATREQMDAAEAKYNMVIKGTRYEEKEMAKNLLYQAENGYKEAKAYHDELYIKSPVDGEVQKCIADPGEIISGGYPVFSLLQLNDQWVTLQLREDMVKGLKVGDELEGKIPALNNSKAAFRVSYISAMADFANWKPTNQKGDFDLKTFEVRIKPVNRIDGLRPGMTVNIRF